MTLELENSRLIRDVRISESHTKAFQRVIPIDWRYKARRRDADGRRERDGYRERMVEDGNTQLLHSLAHTIHHHIAVALKWFPFLLLHFSSLLRSHTVRARDIAHTKQINRISVAINHFAEKLGD